MENIQILWVDDEVDLLKPHILFLQQKGYGIDTVNNGEDALEMLRNKRYDIVFLDENMPGLTGLDTLQRLKGFLPNLPVVMITKSEEERIMEDAIGGKISDYLIKPVNPNQILLSLKKNLDTKRLVQEKTTSGYQQEFRQIGMALAEVRTWEDWVEVYKKLLYWELELDRTEDAGLEDVLAMQKKEANSLFFKFIQKEYEGWFNGNDAPLLSHELLAREVFPLLRQTQDPVVLVVVDNLRFDQWREIQPLVEEYYTVERESVYCAMLPTATQYARNALFAGMLPLEIQKRFPNLWKEEGDDESKNNYESEFLADNLKRNGFADVRFSYHKILHQAVGKKLADNPRQFTQNRLNALVYNFVDMLSHAKTEMEVIRELADNDRAYRALTRTWFRNSSLYDLLRHLSEEKIRLVITTDHGTINVGEPARVVGDRSLNTNLRYKVGRNMSYDKKEVLDIRHPEKIGLPKPNLSANFIFAKEDKFFAYPNNYNHYVKYYKNTYQHGGVSMEEMIVPVVHLLPR